MEIHAGRGARLVETEYPRRMSLAMADPPLCGNKNPHTFD
jgi:hypothetical protein